MYGFDVVLTALLRYKELHGDLIISQRFTVPSDTPEWPQAVWNMKLGEFRNDAISGARNEAVDTTLKLSCRHFVGMTVTSTSSACPRMKTATYLSLLSSAFVCRISFSFLIYCPLSFTTPFVHPVNVVGSISNRIRCGAFKDHKVRLQVTSAFICRHVCDYLVYVCML